MCLTIILNTVSMGSEDIGIEIEESSHDRGLDLTNQLFTSWGIWHD